MDTRKNNTGGGNSHARKHQIVSVFLEDILGRIAPGKRLPGIRELMRLSGCGRPVVQQELRRLVECGKITVCPRSGFYRADKPASRQKIIVLHNFLYPCDGESFVDILLGALRDVLEAEGYEIGFVSFFHKGENYFRQVVEALDTDKVFLIGCESMEMAEFAHRHSPYCVELLPRHDMTLGAEVRDSMEMTSIQLNYLFERNYRRIGYLHHVEKERGHTPVEYHRLFEFYRIMAEHGYAVQPSWVFFAPWTWKDFERSMEKFFSAASLPDAVIVPGSSIPYFYRFCGARGIAIGKDIGVMGCDQLRYRFRARVTTITNDPGQIAETAWQVMKKALAGQIVSCTVTLRVQPGNSILMRRS